ncbi:hypothetical protein FE236_02700 [Mariprofundus erugo]|uniref:Ribosomal RNA small subunit methyltransferase G n=1 Tax=Mariprofundus erugo TaxID=2528639 RepID=A0A5R9GY92_9PROT|nr:RsmG family class I SAM-dependent methyltransferase [Mariprofundus erugo]TLS68772.1 hypothetical protein FEF65_03510 [Mariprofundus erugo]TLS77537.1 hypothetical protein FE236_02700 [Mariprofundus erugo]
MSDTRFDGYVREVLKFRKALNLTSIKDEAEFKQKFILPSLELLNWIPQEGRVLDIGSGMGIPGVPLVIAREGLHGVLVERRKKRAEFLRHLVRTLKLDAEVHDVDVNAVASLKVDICVARAVADERLLLKMCSRHANDSAVAVLPVPLSSEQVEMDDWSCVDQKEVDVHGTVQLIRCYRYCPEVSRET